VVTKTPAHRNEEKKKPGKRGIGIIESERLFQQKAQKRLENNRKKRSVRRGSEGAGEREMGGASSFQQRGG
jgi:hypothetical protein